MEPTTEAVNVPVLIVGAGPSGATLALHLGRLGIRSLVISKHRGTANTPRAHIFNQRAMEVMRDAGLEARLANVACPAEHMQHTSWSNTLNGEEYGRMWSWGNKPSEKHRYETASPCAMSDLPQSVVEPILVEEAIKVGAEVRFYSELVSFEDAGDHVEVVVRNRVDRKEYVVRAKYLVGADGARSQVIDQLGIPIDGVQLNTAFNVHIKADLTKYLVNRPGSLNWVLNADAPDWSAVGNFRMVRPWDEFVVSMHPSSKDGHPFEPSPEQILGRLRQMIGDNDIPITILSSFRWTINDQVARTWQKGRVLCIGDAVHRHPPINGLGSNTCIADAFNLAWKLAYVLDGVAGEALLDTLSIERKPVGDAVVRRANNGMEAHRSLWALLGVTPEDRAKAVALLEAPGMEGREARKQLRQAFEATDAELQALGIQMNQIYTGSPATQVESDDQKPSLSDVDMLKEVAISTYPGFHLPHFWVAASGQSPRQSSLDVCGRGSFTILTGVGGECWLKAAREISGAVPGLRLKALTIGFRCDFMDCYNDWGRVRGTEEDGVVLVRPDHFVAWRYRTSSEDNAVDLLRKALSSVLCIPV
ncbi:hypothetical protein LTR10_003965 [Elasticomyces elasticus]|nr:hypothetical protein LTR10_003965 [Elasticomyces elasticus]KAK4977848.1 hypothetical protein LTR42_002223 [Elasticomyces elasticus]